MKAPTQIELFKRLPGVAELAMQKHGFSEKRRLPGLSIRFFLAFPQAFIYENKLSETLPIKIPDNFNGLHIGIG